MRLSLFILTFFLLCQSIYAQPQSQTILLGNSEVGFNNWPMRSNQSESIFVDDGNLIVTRKKNEGKTILLSSISESYSHYSFKCDILISGSKNSRTGLILNGNRSSFDGYYLEFSQNGQFRIIQISNSLPIYLSGLPLNQGWIKHKKIGKKKFTTEFSITSDTLLLKINDKMVFNTAIDEKIEGVPGFFCEGEAKIIISNLSVTRNDLGKQKSNSATKSIEDTEKDPNDNQSGTLNGTESKNLGDDVYENLFMIIKEKSLRQQTRIAELEREIDRCKAIISMNTNNETEFENLKYTNEQLTKRLEEAETLLIQLQKRNAYLEAMIEEYQSSDDGDLVINLTMLITELKEQLTELQEENAVQKEEIVKLKKDREILFREVKRLKN